MNTRPKILIVDDELFNIDYLEQELEDTGYQTISASNGQEALDQVPDEQPDLILLDIMMPLMDGFEVLRRLKNDLDARNIPVIIISANSDLQSIVNGITLGAEDYLPKPFDPILLKARVLSCLEKKRLRDLEILYTKSLEREMDIAREIQKDFLPSELPRHDKWQIDVYFKAAHEVAGDYYDAFLLPDGNLLFVVGDVCGKGVGAALFMTLFRSLIRVTATNNMSQSDSSVDSGADAKRLQNIINFTNQYLTEIHGDANMFSTIFIGILNVSENVLSYINCGNESALLLRNGKVESLLKPTGPVVGVVEEAQFKVQQVQIQIHDTLIAYTDGIPDALDENGKAFGNTKFIKVVEGQDSDPTFLLDIFRKELEQYIGKSEQFDDITIVAIKRVE